MSPLRAFVIALAAGAVVATGVGLAVAAGPGTQATDRVAQARALADRPVPGSTAVALDRLRAVAQRRGVAVPLPTGGTFSGIRWELLDGTVTEYDVDAVLEYNAACQWLRARDDGRDLDEAGDVLAVLPSWPTHRVSGAGELLAEVIGGRAPDDVAGGVLADCRASHDREVGYARKLGLPPSG